MIETMDMSEAQRSYAANLPVLEVTRGMLTRTIEALRGGACRLPAPVRRRRIVPPMRCRRRPRRPASAARRSAPR
jgi:hypothetical protein